MGWDESTEWEAGCGGLCCAVAAYGCLKLKGRFAGCLKAFGAALQGRGVGCVMGGEGARGRLHGRAMRLAGLWGALGGICRCLEVVARSV